MADGSPDAPDAPDVPDFERIRAEFAGLDAPQHLAMFYDAPDVQLTSGAAFADAALRDDRRCLYIADDNDPETVRRTLAAVGVDVDARTDAGDLQIREAESVYLDDGFDPDGMLRTLETACRESRAAGHDGLAVAGENSWCFHAAERFDPILRFESRFDEQHADLPVIALCQYDLSRFSEASLGKALWTHRLIVYRGRVCENPYYVPPGTYDDPPKPEPELNVRMMLERTRDFAMTDRALERREQRLSVLNRVLRHDVRNDLNVVLGNLRTLAERDDLDPAARECLTTAIDHATSVVETAERARHVRWTLSVSSVEPTDVGVLVEAAADAVERSAAEGLDVRADVDATAPADTGLRDALTALLTDVATRTDGAPTVAVRPPEAGTVAVEVRCPGDPVPEMVREALVEGRETPLGHGSGISLWALRWAAENAGGRLRLPEADDYRVRVELPAVDRDRRV